MPITNNNKPVDMKQLWQQMEPLDTAAITSALSAMTTAEDGSDRYVYYLAGAQFRRYDAQANAWQKLAAPLVTPTVFASIRFSKYGGNYGRVISTPSSTTLKIAAPGISLDGIKIRIVAGTGAGQSRTISACTEPTKHDQGLATTASATAIGDSTKKWKFNQWAGYNVRLTYSTGQTQIRKILYNDTTTLTVSDPIYQPIDPFNSYPFATAPVTTAGAQTHFVIESSTITVPAWTVNPDSSSRYKLETGGVWLLTSAAAGAFFSLQYFDCATDTWQNKTAPTGMIVSVAMGTDGTLERTGEIGGIFTFGTASAGGNYTLTDSTKTWTVDQYKNFRIRITGGTGAGQERRVVCNLATSVEITRKWETNPDATSTYEIIADKDKFYFGGNAQAFLMQYDVDSDLVIQGAKHDDGIANALGAGMVGVNQNVVAITSGTRVAAGITGVNPTPTAPGSNYLVGDILTVTTGGTNGKVIVTGVNITGGVTSIELLRPGGATYVVGTGRATSGGSGTSCTIEITSVGTTCNVATAINHHFKIGDQVVLSGDAAYAGTVTIIGCDSITGFDFATAAAGNMTAANSQSATVIVDSSKNWTAGEHIGKILQTHLTGLAGVVQPRVITGNTATTLTVATITTGLVNGTGRYIITESSMFGRDEQYKDPAMANTGHATGGSGTTLIDTTKNWKTNQWAGAKIRVNAGTGRDYYWTITSNTANTLNYTAPGFTPDTTTHYIIFDTFGTCTGAGSTTTIVDTTKVWAVNQWAGKKVRLMGGAGYSLAAALNEILIVSNTANTLTFVAITGLAPDATTNYCILGVPNRGAGIELVWAYGGVSSGKYMYYPRGGGSNTIDKYDIAKEVYEYAYLINPQTDTLTTGTYYAYDGGDRLYFSPGVATGIVQYIYYLDLTKIKVFGFGSVPNTQLAPVLGNRMEIVTSPAGFDYIYHLRNTGTEMYRANIFI